PSPSSRSPNLTPLSQIKRQLSAEGGRTITRAPPPPQSPSFRFSRTVAHETHSHRSTLVDDDIVDSSDAERDAGAAYEVAVVYNI
ncbi:hypothetical protein GGH99_008662, partial [Coemansia sp. RSA 1285]